MFCMFCFHHQEMIFIGTDTVAILMEWIMARMVLHPDIQAKAQAELDAVVGGGRGVADVADADVARAPGSPTSSASSKRHCGCTATTEQAFVTGHLSRQPLDPGQ